MEGAYVGQELHKKIFPIVSKLFFKLWRRPPESIGPPAFWACNVEMMVTAGALAGRGVGCQANCEKVHFSIGRQARAFSVQSSRRTFRTVTFGTGEFRKLSFVGMTSADARGKVRIHSMYSSIVTIPLIPLNFQDAVLAAVFWQGQAELYVARALQLLEPSVSVQRASAQLLVQQSSAGL